MNPEKRTRLERAEWRTGDAADFLELTPEEAEFVELKLALAHGLRDRRLGLGLTQAMVATMLGSSQSRIAKLEAAAPSVSIDLLVRSLLRLGARTPDVAGIIGQSKKTSTAA